MKLGNFIIVIFACSVVLAITFGIVGMIHGESTPLIKTVNTERYDGSKTFSYISGDTTITLEVNEAELISVHKSWIVK